ncbi:hypothetical protein THAOC_03490, partial [Thalassiosira oceanica]
LGIKHQPVIDLEEEWQNFYKNITDTRVGPDWLNDYMIIKDDTPFEFPKTDRTLERVFCRDQNITPNDKHSPIATCPKKWLENITDRNPYLDFWSVWNNVQLANDTCIHKTCQPSWLNETKNPFQDDDSCYDFFNDCIDENPERYQCLKFWDHCRSKLFELDSYKKHPTYPKEYCDGDPDLTCKLEWLDGENQELTPACQDFSDYCHRKLDETYPGRGSEYHYPEIYCDGDRDLTCKEEWLREYSEEMSTQYQNGTRCHQFWTYCQTRLRTNHTEFVWPLYDEPTVEDYMPGYCCLDEPTDAAFEQDFWGQYSRPHLGDVGYRESFEDFVIDEDLVIYDPSDLDQCQRTRAALGFDDNHLDDHEVCDFFKGYMCDEEFFNDLEYLVTSNNDAAPQSFEQVTYTPITWKKETIHQSWKKAAEKPTPWLDSMKRTRQHMTAALEGVKDLYQKFAQDSEHFEVKYNSNCEAKVESMEQTSMVIEAASQALCLKIPAVVMGTSNPVYMGCMVAGQIKAKVKTAKLMAAGAACRVGANVLRNSVREFNLDTQMRGELQDRHQDMTNDGMFYLGIQIFEAIPGSKIAPGSLSTLCSNLLGVGSRRRLLANEGPYSLKVTYDDNSFIKDIKEIQVTEEHIIDGLHTLEEIEREILNREISILKKEEIIIEKEDIIIEDLATVKGKEDDILQNQEQILEEMQAIREALDITPQTPLPTRPPTRPPTIVTTPRPSSYRAAASCGNDSCEMDETSKSCHDCIGAQLDTTSYDQSMASSSESIKFVIKAKRAVAIKSLFILHQHHREIRGHCENTKRAVQPRNLSDWTTDGWRTVFHGQVFARGYVSRSAQLTTVKFDQDVVLTTGKAQSFEVHTASSRIMVQLGGQEGTLAGQDMALEIHVGRSGAQSPAAFRGIIKYDGLDDSSSAGGGRSKTAKAKAKSAKLGKDVMLDSFLQAESNGEEVVAGLDLVQVDGKALCDKVGAMNDKMGALEENVQAIYKSTNDDVQSIKADVKDANGKMGALETKLSSLETKLSSLETKLASMEA